MRENPQEENVSFMEEILRDLSSIRSGDYPGTYDADPVFVNSLITRTRVVILKLGGKDSIYNEQIVDLIKRHPNLDYHRIKKLTGILDAFIQDYRREIIIEKKSNTILNKNDTEPYLVMIDDYGLDVFKKKYKTINDLVFVLMSFDEKLTQMYNEYIKKPLEDEGYNVVRADDFFKPIPIMDDIWRSIFEAEIIIADLTNRNPNVFYEVGLAHVLGKYTILISQNIEDIPFDLKSIRIIQYKYEPKGFKKLTKDLLSFVKAKSRKT